jgi:AcrR family transcriptional regulator
MDITKQQAKKNEILNAAFRSIYEHGIEGISMRIIAREAHVNQATLHYYFNNKENMLVELLKVLFDKFIFDIEKRFNVADPPQKKLREIFLAGEEFIERQREMFIVFIDFWSISIRNPAMRELFSNLYHKLSDLIENVYEDGVTKEIFPPLPREMISVIVIGFVEGIGLQWHMRGETFNLKSYFDFILKDMFNKLNLEESSLKDIITTR